ncbi:unnamed protein product [Nippostrongylus brasiliensis]|uniref:TGF_BETA_2 domain-containing protein n=1 Tax=Nippostrongylus brasiliensis TaxID=27835 RepID=A0A0N4XCM7_NIPBR|nr:unnamed protein product [Nippostrongylus brasiliensis]
MRVALLLLSIACVACAIEDESVDVLQETIRHLLDFSDIPNGKLDGHEVLIFDISGLGSEQIMRGELHFYLRRRDSAKAGRARQLRAKSVCVNEYCSENQNLETITVSTEKVIWDATKPLAEANALAATQLVVRISRRDIRVRRYAELVKKCSPFLVIYSKADNTIDTEVIRKRVDGTRRKRRELGYFTYNAVESTSRATSTTGKKGLNAFRRHFVGKGQMSKTKKVRGSRVRSPEDDIWHGFGDEPEIGEDEEQQKTTTKSNDVRVVLLGAEEKKAMCQKRGLAVDFKELGWGRWVIAPASFEAGFCSGTCPTPLPKTLLQSPTMAPVCCSPQSSRSLTVFYRDELGRSTVRNFEDMIIEACTCQ